MKLSFGREEKKVHPALWNEVGHFIEKEEHLLRSEFHEKVTQFKFAGLSFVGSFSFLSVGLMCLAITCIAFLSTKIVLWQAAGIVSVVFLSVGGLMFVAAKTKYEASKTKPTRSIDSLEEFKHSFFDRFHDVTKH